MELRDEAISVDAKLANQFQSLMTSSWKSQALYVAAELGIADLLASAPRHGAEMAEALGADQQCLQRLLWALSALGICAEREDGNFELTDPDALRRTLLLIPCARLHCGGGAICGPCGATFCTASGRAKARARISLGQRDFSTSRTIRPRLPSSIG